MKDVGFVGTSSDICKISAVVESNIVLLSVDKDRIPENRTSIGGSIKSISIGRFYWRYCVHITDNNTSKSLPHTSSRSRTQR
jgi:hypothetical protein